MVRDKDPEACLLCRTPASLEQGRSMTNIHEWVEEAGGNGCGTALVCLEGQAPRAHREGHWGSPSWPRAAGRELDVHGPHLETDSGGCR